MGELDAVVRIVDVVILAQVLTYLYRSLWDLVFNAFFCLEVGGVEAKGHRSAQSSVLS